MTDQEIKRILGDEFMQTKSGLYVPKQKHIELLEPELEVNIKLFGLFDRSARRDLIATLKQNGVKRINFVYPDGQNARLLNATLDMLKDYVDAGFLVSVCNINTIEKVKSLKGLKLAFLTKATHEPKVEAYCREHGIPYVPVAENAGEFETRKQEGYTLVKAFHYVKNNLREPIASSKTEGGLLFNAAGGITPVEVAEDGTPREVTKLFTTCADLDCVVSISATHPARCYLYNGERIVELKKLDSYLKKI